MDKIKSIAGIWGINLGMWAMPQTSKLNEDLATIELVLKIVLVVISIVVTLLIARKKLRGKNE